MISAVAAAFLLGDAVLRGGIVAGLLLAPWILLALWAVYVAVFASTVVTDAEGIRVQNFVRVTRIPWAAVADIRMRFQLVVETIDGRTVTCFGGPASARATGAAARASSASTREPAAMRDLDRILDEWERARPAGGHGTDAAARRGWDVPAVIAFLVLAAWAGIAVVVSAGL